jgi:hypothetical protein
MAMPGRHFGDDWLKHRYARTAASKWKSTQFCFSTGQRRFRKWQIEGREKISDHQTHNAA